MGLWDDVDFDAESEKSYSLTPEGTHMANLEKAVVKDEDDYNPPMISIWWRIPTLNKVTFQDMSMSKWDNSKQDFAIACTRFDVRAVAKDPKHTDEMDVMIAVAEALNKKTLHGEIYVKHTKSNNGKTYENTYLNDVFEGAIKEEANDIDSSTPSFDAKEELPF